MGRSRPHIILNAAMSVDGKIATVSGDSGLSSQKDKVRVHKLRSKVDAILVGKNTILRDDPLLTVRLISGRNPTRIILTSSGTIPSECKILQTCEKVPTIIVVSKRISKKQMSILDRFPLDVVISGEESVDLAYLMRILARKNIKSVLVEGGGTVNWEFIKAGLFDEMYITISPLVIGGTKAVSLVQGAGFASIKKSVHLVLNSVKKLDDCLVLHYTKTLTHS